MDIVMMWVAVALLFVLPAIGAFIGAYAGGAAHARRNTRKSFPAPLPPVSRRPAPRDPWANWKPRPALPGTKRIYPIGDPFAGYGVSGHGEEV